jgi:HAD superfamily hydrolase (TIGR01549 family)
MKKIAFFAPILKKTGAFMYSDLIFDFDGTLSDTYPVVTEAFLQMLAENGIHEEYDVAYARLKKSYGYAISCYEWPFPPKEVAKELGERALALGLVKQKPIEGARELLAAAAKKGCRCFVYTHSGPDVKGLMDKWGVSSDITFVLDNSFGFPRKPAPDALLYLIDRFGIDRKNALMVGDRDIDIEVGHNVGMDGCLFDVGNFYPDC